MSSDTNEAVADILREMRDRVLGEDRIKYMLPADDALAFADRIEAALAREREMSKGLSKKLDKNHAIPGNAAAMREALVQCELFLSNVSRHGHPTLNPNDKCTACNGVEELRGMVVRALAELARNCDVLSEKEANEAWKEYRHSHVLPRGGWDFRHIIAWLFAKAEGGAE